MLAGFSYVFTEPNLRMFFKRRTIKRITKIENDSEPVEFIFTDGYKVRLTHIQRNLSKGVAAPYFSVEIIKPDGLVLLQEALRKLMIEEGKIKEAPRSSKRTKKKTTPIIKSKRR